MTATVVEVTPKTRWIFVQLTTQAGLQGTGEATLVGKDAAVIAAAADYAPDVFALSHAAPDALATRPFAGLPQAAAFSAIDQALWDVAARRDGRPLAAALGAVRRDAIPVYGNINRRTLDRSPAGFADSARIALAAGHTAFKLAPFDEATPEARQAGALADAIQPGLRRIEAVRALVGDRRLMVDCHWRLDEAVATLVIDAAAELGLHWVECPLPETAEQMEALVRLRHRANRRGVLLAGCELGIGLDAFQPFIDAGAYDVMMPDVKYVGGLAEVLRLAEAMQRASIAFSPHNPTGPVCHAASMHVSAVVEQLDSLESQFDETPLFDALAGQALQTMKGGMIGLAQTAGLGLDLQPAALAGCRVAGWTAMRQGDGFAMQAATIVPHPPTGPGP